MYKSKLQELCNKKKWALPKYSCVRDGADHNPQFKASVVVNGNNFDAFTICKSIKDAYNEAAKLAFLHFTSDLEHKYKMKLQMYAEKNNLGLPLYCTIEEGPDNALCYKTTVTIARDIFEGPGYYRTINHAEEAAAQAALLELSIEAFQENDIHMYKNLLQELSRKEGFFMSNYVTTRSGQAHDPIFVSTVEVEGETFNGDPGKSKKQAEHNVARVAYKSFMKRKLGRMYEFASNPSDDDVLKLAVQVEKIILAEPESSCKCVSPISTPSSKHDALVEVNEDDLSGVLPPTPKDSSRKASTGIAESFLLGNRFRVYTYIPDAVACNGNVVLPISEDKWVVASLEFPE